MSVTTRGRIVREIESLNLDLPLSLNGGHYLLFFRLGHALSLQVGSLGCFDFQPGLYCYVGRAKRDLRQRIVRHCRSDKPRRWHIDHLILHVEMVAVALFPLTGVSECGLAQKMVRLGGICHPPMFGAASDCRCPGHLVRFPIDIEIEVLLAQVG